jgi:DNA polymerase
MEPSASPDPSAAQANGVARRGTELDPEAELAFLRAALEAHLDHLADTGALGLPPCDEPTLEARRARYRELAEEFRAEAREQSAAPVAATAPPSAPLAEPVTLRSARPDERSSAPSGSQPGADTARSSAVRGPAQAPASTATRLPLLEAEVRTCTRCALHETRTQTVFARGNGASGVCFVGEGPGADEDAAGLPFVGAAGQLLDKMIAGMGLERDEVYVCNVVKCRPPKNRKPERDEIDACRDYLSEQLELISPRVIVALGSTAVEGLLGLRGIQRLRGQWRLYRGTIPVMPTFHPAYVLREPSAKRLVWNDLKMVLEHLGRSVPEPRSVPERR